MSHICNGLDIHIKSLAHIRQSAILNIVFCQERISELKTRDNIIMQINNIKPQLKTYNNIKLLIEVYNSLHVLLISLNNIEKKIQQYTSRTIDCLNKEITLSENIIKKYDELNTEQCKMQYELALERVYYEYEYIPPKYVILSSNINELYVVCKELFKYNFTPKINCFE